MKNSTEAMFQDKDHKHACNWYIVLSMKFTAEKK
jgi:hypothetical protein